MSAQHIIPVKVYLAIYATLLVLTGTTVAVAFVDLGTFNLAAALAIAILKATLVVLFFMHVKYSVGMVKVFVSASVLWLLIMIVITLSDYVTRAWIATPKGWQQ